MRITLNGKPCELEDGLTIAKLLDLRGVSSAQVAVEINCDIIARERFTSQSIKENDIVEILRFVGGG
jgi:sulfur carrier protein